jgi:hypothetical protein
VRKSLLEGLGLNRDEVVFMDLLMFSMNFSYFLSIGETDIGNWEVELNCSNEIGV